MARDLDQPKTQNSSFHYEIKSVSPDSPNAEFFIEESGAIYYKGCLDYEARETTVPVLSIFKTLMNDTLKNRLWAVLTTWNENNTLTLTLSLKHDQEDKLLNLVS